MRAWTREQMDARARGENPGPPLPPSDGCGGCKSLFRKLAGGVKLAAVDLGLIGATPEPERAARQEACEGCEAFDFGLCRDCGCVLWAKVRVAGEQCPRGRWTALTVDGQPPAQA